MKPVKMYYLLGGGGSAAAGTVVLTDLFISNVGMSAAQAAIRFNNNGTLEKKQVGWTTIAGEWLASAPDTATAALYELRATLLYASSDIDDGTFGTWIPLSTACSYSVSESTPGFETSATIKFEIRLASSKAVVDSATVYLSASVT